MQVSPKAPTFGAGAKTCIHAIHAKEQISAEIFLNRDDLVKIEALAEVYQLPKNDLLANLINTALQEVEIQIPYVAGSKIIRTEEGDPIYEDVGRTPDYLAAQARLKAGK